MRHLGIDYGTKRIGIAISSEGIAFPRGVIANDEKTVDQLKELIEKEKVERVVIGDTRSFGGKPNKITDALELFAEKLEEELSLPVILSSEAGTSVEASRYQEKKRDESAAAIILQRYLDTNASHRHS